MPTVKFHRLKITQTRDKVAYIICIALRDHSAASLPLFANPITETLTVFCTIPSRSAWSVVVHTSVFAMLEHRPFKQRYQFVLPSYGHTNRTRTSDGSPRPTKPFQGSTCACAGCARLNYSSAGCMVSRIRLGI